MSTPPRATGRPTVGLTMIVRDAAATIEAGLASALPFIDAWTVVDTGSEDATVDLVRSSLRDLPGALHERPWRDFGTNRSEALRLAAGSADYLLLLDADETISGPPLPPLWMDGHDLQLVDEERWEPRLIRADLPWRFIGAARDRLSCAVPVVRRRMPDASIRHHQAPGARTDALERDARLVRASLESDPANLLSRFELAMLVLALGDIREARTLFDHCAAADTWDELRFCAAHQLARIAAQDDPEGGVERLLDAWEQRPSRVEPLLDLARLANGSGRPTRALMASSVGITLREPADDLMVQPWAYAWRIRLEHAVSLHLVGRSPEAMRLLDGLIADPRIPRRLRVDALGIRQAVVDATAESAGTHPRPEDVSVSDLGAVPLLAERVGALATVEIPPPVPGPWRLTGASVAGNGSGFALQLTAADGRDAGVPAATRHFLQTHDDTGAPVLVREVLGEARVDETRLVWCEDAWQCLASADGETFLLDLDRDPGPERHGRDALPGVGGADAMPFVVDDRLLVVTGLDPFEIVAWDRSLERPEVVTPAMRAPGLAGWTGGSSGLRTADGVLFVIRRVSPGERFQLVTHRFLALDDRLRPAAASREFVFGRYGTEACRGLARWGEELLCGHVSDQGRGWMTALPYELVRAALLPLT